MKRVLWISRHQMTAEQRSDLERVIGEAVELHPWTETVEDLEDLRRTAEESRSLPLPTAAGSRSSGWNWR